MKAQINRGTVDLVRGNIVEQDVDAIVNAANTTLLGGGGVDGAIHRAAGPELLEECRQLGGCPTGEARITRGYQLPARYVIHAVGPVYSGRPRDADLLRSAYRNSLQLAAQHQLKSIACPAISAGAYGYPLNQAAEIALGTVIEFLQQHDDLQVVRFVLWNEETFSAFRNALVQLMANIKQ
jgi:O-acetyl-ADP-ribose deacetylase (regulator of RNase III)